ncbi:MAG: hypothetical protein JWM68_3613 [Verrucomicrobiales bacterium]|nr:hypothetical protein [Verrucomicrobiales bacterium]
MMSAFCGSLQAEPIVVKSKDKKEQAAFWLETSMKRIFPSTEAGNTSLHLLAARNSRIAFQACLQNRSTAALYVDCKTSGADAFKPLVRLVGFAPMWHHTAGTSEKELDGVGHIPGLVPDPLWPMQRANAGTRESRSFWITLNIPADAKPGMHEFKVELTVLNGEKIEMPVQIEIAELVVQPRKDFPVIHWWRGEATWDYYKTGMFEDQRWWDITRSQMEDMLAHGSDVAFVPIFFERRETFKRPCQLLIVNEPSPGKYEFDFSLVKRFLDMSKEVGFKQFEWQHFWIYWGVEHPMRIYKKEKDQYVMLWKPDISGFSDTYIDFLKQFLPQFHNFLRKEGVLDQSYFHLSDEPGGGEHIVRYRKARQILRDLAPWMQGKVMDALSHIEYGREGITDIPIPIVSSAQKYVDEKIPHWVYYCCSPTGDWLNRFMDTPLPKIRMSGMLFYRMGAKGFLHWGYNYWHKMEREDLGDPFTDASNSDWPGIPYGDPFMIYPGADGKPMDSIRWEVFAESLQDYAILQTAGIKPEDALLSDLKTYAKFPKDEEWIQQTLTKILKPVKATAKE